MKTGKLIILLLCMNLLLFSCETTKYITPELPGYNPTIPDRPELLEIPEGYEIPEEVNINQILLMGYAEKLEISLENWERFYNELTKLYKNDSENKQ